MLSRIAMLNRRIEHGGFWAILGPSTVDLVAANSGEGDRVMHGVGGGSGWPEKWPETAMKQVENRAAAGNNSVANCRRDFGHLF